MNTDSYISRIEELAEDADVSLTDKQKEKFAKLSISLEGRGRMTVDDIYEELEVVIPTKFKDDEGWLALMEELSIVVHDESIQNEDDEEVEEEDEE